MNERFGIPAKRKIAVFAGSVAEWTMARKLVDSLPLWADDWVLVIHDRYGGVSEWQRVARQHIPNRFYISDDSFPSIEGLGHLLHGADLGIALYHPTYDSAWTGRNIANLGMSSGKIATYMQHGLPVLINELGEISDHVREKALGMVVRDVCQKSPESSATLTQKRRAPDALDSFKSFGCETVSSRTRKSSFRSHC